MTIRWYPIYSEAVDLVQSDRVMLPPIEDAETGISVDVLVFGYFLNAARDVFFGIGYWQGHRYGTWHVNTSNGAYDIPGDDDTVVLLAWASLPDAPPMPENI